MKRKGLILLPLIVLAAALAVFLLIRGQQALPEKEGIVSTEATAAVPQESDATTDTQTTEAQESSDSGEEPAGAPDHYDSGEEATDAPEQPFLVQITEDDPSVAYVLVRMPDPIGLLPLPVEGEYTRTIRQIMADGSEAINVLHLTVDGCWMEDANCEGHDCINEGEVTLANREERVLWNMIICLPHQLSLELITREEAEQLLGIR